MSENNETLEVEIPDTVAEVVDLFNRQPDEPEAEAPAYHTILEVWREVLSAAEPEGRKKPAPQWCGKMVSSYPNLTFAECLSVRDRYFAKLAQVLDVLNFEIDSHPGCLSHTTPEDDVAENTEIYQAVLLTWQQLFLQWELEWTCNHVSAPAEFAALAEAYKTLFGDAGRPGISAYLDNVKFEYTEDFQATVGELLHEQREAYVEAGVTGE